MSPSISRSSPNWIQQWAAQVAEQTNQGNLPDLSPVSKGSTNLGGSNLASSNLASSNLVSPRGSKVPSSMMLSGSQDGSGSENILGRPRRKLPQPPTAAGYNPNTAELEMISRRVSAV